MPSPETSSQPTLARNMGFFALVVFGVGDMVGAGIYGTIGKAAGLMGNAVWIGFVAAMIAAMLTGLSYASIASRYPRAAGAAYVTQHAFHLPLVAYVVGLAVCASGMTSMAATGNVFAENIQALVPAMKASWGKLLAIAAFLAILTFINFWGIRESVWMNALCAIVEIGGLVFVVIVGSKFWGTIDYFKTPPGVDLSAGLILSGAVLTFFAFIGFEDMLNVAEEVKDPARTLPYGMVTAILIVTVLYISVAVTAVSVVPFEQLRDTKNHGAPFAQITRIASPWLHGGVFAGITLFAVTNTALINYIMGSRLLYGMSKQGLLPRWIGRVHPVRRTPHVAIFTVGLIVLTLAVVPNLAGIIWPGGKWTDAVDVLARSTALLLLSCFAVVNFALIVLQRRPGEPKGRFEVPMIIPALGSIVCTGLIVGRLVTAYRDQSLTGDMLTTSVLFACILALYFVVRPKNIPETDAEIGDEIV